MKFVIIFVLAILACANANCGCLKCSKHLRDAGDLPGGPGYGPIKVIYRCPNANAPTGCDYPNIHPIEVQKPVDLPDAPLSYGSEHSYRIQHFYRPCAYEPRVIHPISVQKPLVAPEVPVNCVPLTGLKASIDRVVLPAPVFAGLEDHKIRFNSIYKQCPQLLINRERECCRSCCPCSRGPLLQKLYDDRYGNQDLELVVHPETEEIRDIHTRSKRQVPFLDHSYKFMMNMLPPFIQDPIKNAVNVMALTHPDKKLQKMYNRAPEKTLHEKLVDQHKKNVAKLKEKLYGPPPKKSSKKYVIEDTLRREASNFLDSLHEAPSKPQKYRMPRMKSRTPSNEDETEENRHWLKEMKARDVLEDDLKSKKSNMSGAEKALLLLKLKKLNDHKDQRSKRDIPKKPRKKRSIVIDSEEFELPLYKIRLQDSNEATEENDDFEYEDEDYYEPRERILGRSRKYSYEDSRERLLRKAIREELRNFKRVESSEEVASPFQLQKTPFQSPLGNLFTLPMKVFSGFHNFNKQAAPVVGSVPKMIVGTKRYFRDFGKNLKRNLLHFASDVIGDFDHDGPSNNILGDIFNPGRHKRSVDGMEMKIQEDTNAKMEHYEPEYTLDFNNENFRNASKNKVRKKRYILKMVDDDEVEEILRKKLERLFEESAESYEAPRRKYRRKKHNDDYSGERLQSKRYSRNKNYEDSDENYNKKIVVEKVRPKIIIDNNGLPFMEMDGYKRPIFIKNKKKNFKKKFRDSAEDNTFANYDSSEEANMDKIHHVIHSAKTGQLQSTRNTEMPIQTVKERISQLLYETDVLVHMDFEKYDEIYDDLIKIQHIKTSTVQDWKRLIMEKRINDREAKIALLGKFHDMQSVKEIAVKNIVYALYLDHENKFVIEEFTKMLVRLQKLQCVVNQVVGCFQQKFNMGTKFEMAKEIKFVDFLTATNFVNANTRNDLIAKLKEARDVRLQENIRQIDRIKKLLVKHDDEVINEEANILWEMRNIQQMQTANIEEMYHKMEEDCKIRKNLKILIDFWKRLQTLNEQEKKLQIKMESQESSEEVEVSIEDKKSVKIERNSKKPKKFDIEDFKKKWQERMKKQKFLIEKNFKKTLYKLKVKDGSSEYE